MKPNRFKVRGWVTQKAKDLGCPPNATYDTFTIRELMEGRCTYNYYENWEESTGLTDKNGKEIFEGDIIKWSSWKLGTTNAEESRRKNSEVKWNNDRGAWVLDDDSAWNMAIYSDIEIIGNIKQNPELLKN